MQRWFEMKVDVSKLPYKAVLEAVDRAKWAVEEFACDNGRVVLVCSPG